MDNTVIKTSFPVPVVGSVNAVLIDGNGCAGALVPILGHDHVFPITVRLFSSYAPHLETKLSFSLVCKYVNSSVQTSLQRSLVSRSDMNDFLQRTRDGTRLFLVTNDVLLTEVAQLSGYVVYPKENVGDLLRELDLADGPSNGPPAYADVLH